MKETIEDETKINYKLNWGGLIQPVVDSDSDGETVTERTGPVSHRSSRSSWRSMWPTTSRPGSSKSHQMIKSSESSKTAHVTIYKVYNFRAMRLITSSCHLQKGQPYLIAFPDSRFCRNQEHLLYQALTLSTPRQPPPRIFGRLASDWTAIICSGYYSTATDLKKLSY